MLPKIIAKQTLISADELFRFFIWVPQEHCCSTPIKLEIGTLISLEKRV